MKELEQRIAIAEACGWNAIRDGDAWGTPIGIPKDVQRRDCWIGAEGFYEIPNYLNDLNAMHQAEKMLDARQLNNYEYERARLCNLTVATSMASAFRWHATASQRAEAFLHTLNLWKD